MEEDCFLPDMGECRILELSYVSALHEFVNSRYEQESSSLLYDLSRKGADDETLEEAYRCLRHGSVRADWMDEKEKLDIKIQEAKGIHDKNYWICMRKMAERMRSHTFPPL